MTQDDFKNLFVAFIMSKQDYTYQIYLVNPTDTNYPRVVGLTGAFTSCDDDLLKTSRVVKEIGVLRPHSFVLIEEDEWDQLDFVIWYHLDLYSGQNQEKREMLTFSLPKYGLGYEDKISDLPILNIKGMKIESRKTIGGESIEEKVKHMDMESKYYEFKRQK